MKRWRTGENGSKRFRTHNNTKYFDCEFFRAFFHEYMASPANLCRKFRWRELEKIVQNVFVHIIIHNSEVSNFFTPSFIDKRLLQQTYAGNFAGEPKKMGQDVSVHTIILNSLIANFFAPFFMHIWLLQQIYAGNFAAENWRKWAKTFPYTKQYNIV